MEFNELIAELRAASENLPNDSADRSHLSSLYCNKACKAIDRIAEDPDYNNVITGLWLIVAHFAEQLAYLKPVPPLSELCFKLFRQCAKSVLNIQWQNLEEDSSVRQNFLVSLANLHSKLIPFDFPRFRLLEALTENPWTNPTLAKVMGGEVEDGDREEVRSYIEQEDPIILQLRVDMMLRENCEEYALNLCNSCLTHPELQTDLSIRKIQLSLLYKLGHEDRLHEECQKLSIQDALRIIKQLQTSQPHRQLCTVLAQTFMVQNWIRPSDMEANKELLRLWIRQQLLVDREQDQFKESVWAMAKLSQSTEQIVIFIDVLREECGDAYLQLYVDMCIFAINVDKGQMETNIKEGNLDSAIARRSDMASICTKLSCLCHHTSLKVARICALTSFTLRPSEQSFSKIGIFYGQAGGCCNKCGLEKTHEPGKVNPATLYEVERLLNMLRPDYLNPENSFSNIQALCRRFLHESVKNAQIRNQQLTSSVSILSVPQIEGPGKKKIMPQGNKSNNLFEALTPQDIQNTQSLLNKMRLQSMPPPKPTHNIQNAPRIMSPSGGMRPHIHNNQQNTAFKTGLQNKPQYLFDAEKVKCGVPFGVSVEQQQYYTVKHETEPEQKQKYTQKKTGKSSDSLGTNIQISQQPSSVMLQNQIKQKQLLLQRNAQVSQMIQSAMRQDANALQGPDIVQAVLNIMKGSVLKQTSSLPKQQTPNQQIAQTSTISGTQPLPTVSTLLKPQQVVQKPSIHPQVGQSQPPGQPSPRKYPRPQLYAQPIIVSTAPSLTSLSNRLQIATGQSSRNNNLHGINVISTMSSAQRQGAENQMSKSQADSIRQYMQMSNQKQIAEQRQMSGSTVTLNNIHMTSSRQSQINVGAVSRPRTTVELAEQASLAKEQEKLANYHQQVRVSQPPSYSHTNQRLPKNNQQQHVSSNQPVLMSHKHLLHQNSSFSVNNCHQNSSLLHNQALPPSDELSGSITGIDDTIIKELLQDSGILANTFPDIEVDNIGDDKSRKLSEQALASSQHNLSLHNLDALRRTYTDTFQAGGQFSKYSLASSAATSQQSATRSNQLVTNTSQLSQASTQPSSSLMTKNPNALSSNQPVSSKVSQPYIDISQNRLQKAFNQGQFSMKPTGAQLQRDSVRSHVGGQSEQKPTMDQLREMMKKEEIEGEICMDSANNATYRCIICSLAFETLDALREHVRNVCKPGLQSSSVYNNKIKQDRANSAKAGVETTTVFQCLRCFELCVSDVGIKEHRLTCKRVPTVPSDLKKDAANKAKPPPKPTKPLAPKKEPRDNSHVVPELPLPFPYPTLNAGAILKGNKSKPLGRQLSGVSMQEQPSTSLNISYPQTLARSDSQSSHNKIPSGTMYNTNSSHLNHLQNSHENQTSMYNLASDVGRSNTPKGITGVNINVNMYNVKTGAGAPVAGHVVVNLDQSTLPPVMKENVSMPGQVSNITTILSTNVTLGSSSALSNMPHDPGTSLLVKQESTPSLPTSTVSVPQIRAEQGPSKKVKEKVIKPKVKKLPPPSFTEVSGSGGNKFYKCNLCSQTLCSLESFVIHWEQCATKNKSLLRRMASREKLLNAKPMTGEILQNVLSVIDSVASDSGTLEVQLGDNESDADSRLLSLLDPCATDNDLVESNDADSASWVESASPDNDRDSIDQQVSEEEKDIVSSEKESLDDSVEYKQRRRKYLESDGDEEDHSLSESDQNIAFVSTRDAPPKLRDRKTLKPIHSFINETYLSPYYKGTADKLGLDGEDKTPSPMSDEVDSEGDGLSCPVCKTTYQTKRMLLQHCAGKHLKPYTVKSVADSSSYFCHLCQKTFSTFMHFMQHVPNHSVTIYEKMKSYAASIKLSQHSQRIASQRGFMKKGALSPKMAKALKSKKAAKKSAVDKLKRELLSCSTHSVRETQRHSKRKRSLSQKFTSSEEDYSTDASNNVVFRSKRADSESSLVRGITLRGRGRPRKQSSIEEASSTEDSGPKLAKSPDHDYIASDDAYDSEISLVRAPPITRSRKRSNQTLFYSNSSKRKKLNSFSEDISDFHEDDSASGTPSRHSHKKIVSRAGVIEIDSDSNSATLTFVEHNNGNLVPVSDSESADIDTSKGTESTVPEISDIKTQPRKITVRSLSRRLKEKLKSCDLHPTIVLEALTSENIENSSGDCKSKEAKSEPSITYKCSFLDSFLSYLNHYPSPTSKTNSKTPHLRRPAEQRKNQNLDDKSLSSEVSGSSPVIRSRSSSIDGSVSSTDPGSLADTEGSTISYSTASEKESNTYALQGETNHSGDLKSFLAKFPTRRCSVNLGRKINPDSLTMSACTNLAIDLESPTVKENIPADVKKCVKLCLESSGSAIVGPVEPVVRLRRISVPVGDHPLVDLSGAVNTKNVEKDNCKTADCVNESYCVRSTPGEETQYSCSASWHEEKSTKLSQRNTMENILNEEIQASVENVANDKLKSSSHTVLENVTHTINTWSTNVGTSSTNKDSDHSKNAPTTQAESCAYIIKASNFLDEDKIIDVRIDDEGEEEEECLEPSGESEDFYIVKELSDHELDDSKVSEEEPDANSEEEPDGSKEKKTGADTVKEPSANTVKEPSANTEKEPDETSAKEPDATSVKEPVATSEMEPVATSEMELVATSEKESVATSEKEPDATSVKEPDATSEMEPVATSEMEPVATSEKESVATSEKESVATSKKEPDSTSEKKPVAISEKEPEATSAKESHATSEKEPDATSEMEPDTTIVKQPDPTHDAEPNNRCEKELKCSSATAPKANFNAKYNSNHERVPKTSIEVESNCNHEKEPKASREEESNSNHEKERNANSEKEPNNTFEKELNSICEKKSTPNTDEIFNLSIEKEYANSEQESKNNNEMEPKVICENAVSASSEEEFKPNHEKKPNKSEEEPNPSSENEPNPSSESEPNPSSENEPNPSSENEPNPSSESEPYPSSESEPNPSSENEPNPSSESEPNPSSGNKPYLSSENEPNPIEKQQNLIIEKTGIFSNDTELKVSCEIEHIPTNERTNLENILQTTSIFVESGFVGISPNKLHVDNLSDNKQTVVEEINNYENCVYSMPVTSHIDIDTKNSPHILYSLKSEQQINAGALDLVSEVTGPKHFDVFKELNTGRSQMPLTNLSESYDSDQHFNETQLSDSDPQKQIVEILNLRQHAASNDVKEEFHQGVIVNIDQRLTTVSETGILKLTQEFSHDIQKGLQETQDIENDAQQIVEKNSLQIETVTGDRTILSTPVFTLATSQQSLRLSSSAETMDLIKVGHTLSSDQIKYPTLNSIHNVSDSKTNLEIENQDSTKSVTQFFDASKEMSSTQNYTSSPTSFETFSVSDQSLNILTELSVDTKLLSVTSKDAQTLSLKKQSMAIASGSTDSSIQGLTLNSNARKKNEKRKPSEALVRNPNISLAAFIHERLLNGKEKVSIASHISDNTNDVQKEKTGFKLNVLEANVTCEKSQGSGLVDYSSSDDEHEETSLPDSDCVSGSSQVIPSSTKLLKEEMKGTQYPPDNGNNVYTFHCITETPQSQPLLKLNNALYSHSVFMSPNSSSTSVDLKQMLETHSVCIENQGRNGHFQLLEEKGCHCNSNFNGLDKNTDVSQSLKTLHCEIIVDISEVDGNNDPQSHGECSDVSDLSRVLNSSSFKCHGASQHISNNDEKDKETCQSSRDNLDIEINEPFLNTENLNNSKVYPSDEVKPFLEDTFTENKSLFMIEEPKEKNILLETKKIFSESKYKNILKSHHIVTRIDKMSTGEETSKISEGKSYEIEKYKQPDTKLLNYFLEDNVELLSPCVSTEKSEEESPKSSPHLQFSDQKDCNVIFCTSPMSKENETILHDHIDRDIPFIKDTLCNVILDVKEKSLDDNKVTKLSAENLEENLFTEPKSHNLTSQDTEIVEDFKTPTTRYSNELDNELIKIAVPSLKGCEDKEDEEHCYSDVFKNDTCDKNRQDNQYVPVNESKTSNEVLPENSRAVIEDFPEKESIQNKEQPVFGNNVREIRNCPVQIGSEAFATIFPYQKDEEIKHSNSLSEESERQNCNQKFESEVARGKKFSESGGELFESLNIKKSCPVTPEVELSNKMQDERNTHTNHSFNSYSRLRLSGDLDVNTEDCQKSLNSTSSVKPYKEDDCDKSSSSTDPDEDFDLIIEKDTSSRNLILFKSSPEKEVIPKTLLSVAEMKPVKRIFTKVFALPHTHTNTKKNEHHKILSKKPLRKASQEQFKWDDDEESKTPRPMTAQLTFTVNTNDAIKISSELNDKLANDKNVPKQVGKRKVLQEKTETSPFLPSLEDTSLGKVESKLKVTTTISQPGSVVEGKPKRLIQKKRSYSPSDHKSPDIPAKIKKSTSAHKLNRTSNPRTQTKSRVEKGVVNKRETVNREAEDLRSANNNSIAVDEEISFKKDSFSPPIFESQPCLPTLDPLISTGGHYRLHRFKTKSFKSSLPGTAHLTSIPLETKTFTNNIHTSEEKTPIGLRSRHSSVESNKSDRSSSSKRQTDSHSQTSVKRGRKTEDSSTPMWQKIGLIKITPNIPNVISSAENAPMTRSSGAAMKAYNQKSLRNREVNPLDIVSVSSPTIKGGQTVRSRSPLVRSPVLSKLSQLSPSARHSPLSQPKSFGATKISKRLNDSSTLSAVVKRRVPATPVPSRQSQVKTSVKGTRLVTPSSTVFVVDPVPKTQLSENAKKTSFIGARTIHTQLPSLPSETIIKPKKSERQNLSILKGTKTETMKRHRRKT